MACFQAEEGEIAGLDYRETRVGRINDMVGWLIDAMI